MMAQRPGWKQVRNLLCIRLDNLGDVLMTTPAMRALKHTLPGCRLTLLASASGAAAARFIPEVDEALAYAAPWMKSSADANATRDLETANLLRERRFDAAVIFTAYSQSPLPAAMLCHLADIPLRLAHCRENPYHLLTDWIRETEPEQTVRHEVRRQLDLVAQAGCTTNDERLSFSVSHDAAAWARHHLHTIGIDLQRPWLLLHPGATAASRRYPPKLWAQALNLIFEKLECPIIFGGGAADILTVEEIQADLLCPSFSLAGKLELDQFAAIVAQAPVLLANNSGPAHLAAAVGTPVVDLYALTNFQHTPWGVPNRVLYHPVACAPCYKSICPQGHHDCLQKVSPARVAEETLDLLQETRRPDFAGTVLSPMAAAPKASLQPLFSPRQTKDEKSRPFLEPLAPIVIRADTRVLKKIRSWNKRRIER